MLNKINLKVSIRFNMISNNIMNDVALIQNELCMRLNQHPMKKTEKYHQITDLICTTKFKISLYFNFWPKNINDKLMQKLSRSNNKPVDTGNLDCAVLAGLHSQTYLHT